MFNYVIKIKQFISFYIFINLCIILGVHIRDLNSQQRKTTHKWKENGDLSELDMLRILDKLSLNELNVCDLTCSL